jgi:vacuolar-type H+-ATPase subunit H
MSVLKNDTTSEPAAGDGAPRFPVALRGYERQQVDTFIQEQALRLAAERRRAEQAEVAASQMRLEVEAMRDQSPPSFEQLGSEAARILKQAGNSATLLIEEARIRGDALVAEARAQAAEIIKNIEQQAAEMDAASRKALADASQERDRLLADARAEAERLRDHAERDARTKQEESRGEIERARQQAIFEQRAIETETARLRDYRDRMRAYLGRINNDLGALLADEMNNEPDAPSSSTADTRPGAGGEPEASETVPSEQDAEEAHAEHAQPSEASTFQQH